MSLSTPTPSAKPAAAVFETEDQTVAAATSQASAQEAAAATAAAAPAAEAETTATQAEVAQETTTQEVTSTATSTAVVASASSALAIPAAGSRAALIAQSNVIAAFKNAMPVSWEDFSSINANQGQFLVKSDNNKALGATISLKLVSFQDQFVSAPDDQNAEGEDLIKYSDDGVNANDGSMTIEEHQAHLKSMNLECKVSHRLVLVGELLEANEAGLDLVGDLVQVILPESGRRNFNSFTKQAAYHVSEARLRAGDAEYLTLSASMAGSGKKVYTMVKASYMEGHGPVKGGRVSDQNVIDV